MKSKVSLVAVMIVFLFLLVLSFLSNVFAYPALKDSRFKVETVATGINHPTTMTFIGKNDILVAEKNGQLKRVVNGQLLNEPLASFNVTHSAGGGLLGVASAKKGANNIVYLTVAEVLANSTIKNRLYKFDMINGKLLNRQLLLDVPGKCCADHYGGVILLGPGKSVFRTTGDLDQLIPPTKAINVNSSGDPNGTGGILKITTSGKSSKGIIGDNYPSDLYYAYGIRNSFGLDRDPVTGIIWDTENGPIFGDEVNLVRPGFNSGWKVVQGPLTNGIEFDIALAIDRPNNLTNIKNQMVTFGGTGKYSDPKFTWQDTVGVTAIKFFNSNKMGSEYKNDAFVGDFKYGRIYDFKLAANRTQFVLDGPLSDKIANRPEELNTVIFGQGFNGVTDLKIGPDGYLYVVSIGDGAIYRIIPVA